MRSMPLLAFLGLTLAAGLALAQPQPGSAPPPPAQPTTPATPAALAPASDAPARATVQQPASDVPPVVAPKADVMVLHHTMNLLDGTPQDLAAFKGQVVLIVNTASRCGYTPQYARLEALSKAKKAQGLVVLGFPSNDFGNQEPGDSAQIRAFCDETYGVTFPLFEKVKVKGEEACPLFKQLTAQDAPIGGEPKWNFTKYLVSREGKIVARFETRTQPDDPAFVRAIDDVLASGVPAPAAPPSPPSPPSPAKTSGPDQR